MLWQYYQRSGGCKFGKACKFNHTRGYAAPISELNFLGLPIRLVQTYFLHMKRFLLFHVLYKIVPSEMFKNVLFDRERKSAPITCVLALVSLDQTVGLIILILQLWEEVILNQGMVMEGLFHCEVYPNSPPLHGLLHQES